MSMEPHLFFSQAVVDLERVRFQTRPYTVHQIVADLFGDREGRGYLFYEIEKAPGQAEVLILSEERPDDSVARAAPGSVESIRTKPFELGVDVGTVLDYEIRINATRVVTDEDGKKKRTDVWDAVWGKDKETPRTPDEVYEEYLSRKLESAAEILETHVVGRGGVTARAPKHSRPIFFVATTLIGTLRVLDPDPLLETIGGGIGRAKAFGCGLLCLSRPGSVLPRRYPDKTLSA